MQKQVAAQMAQMKPGELAAFTPWLDYEFERNDESIGKHSEESHVLYRYRVNILRHCVFRIYR